MKHFSLALIALALATLGATYLLDCDVGTVAEKASPSPDALALSIIEKGKIIKISEVFMDMQKEKNYGLREDWAVFKIWVIYGGKYYICHIDIDPIDLEIEYAAAPPVATCGIKS